jgi:UDP-N-acetylglucosamine 2-epimerase (non-hydrolysing)
LSPDRTLNGVQGEKRNQMPASILHVVATRPNFMKVAPIMRAVERSTSVEQVLVHTGQHYDEALSHYFFEDLGLPKPDMDLGVGSGSHGILTGRVMIALQPVLERYRPDWVVTVGSTDSALAAALVAAKLGLRIARVEAGLRSRNWAMAEEINRVLADRLGRALFTTEESAHGNLRREGIPESRIHFAGNVMIDTLDRYRPRAARLRVHTKLGLTQEHYVLTTLHRPQNVDDPVRMAAILRTLPQVVYECDCPVVLPLHPRTARNIKRFGLEGELKGIRVMEPVRYLEFLSLMDGAGAVLTDSGSIEDETTVLGVPCVTLRPETERPITLTEGTNRLFDGNLNELADVVGEAFREPRSPCRPELWDGRAAERIAEVILGQLATSSLQVEKEAVKPLRR